MANTGAACVSVTGHGTDTSYKGFALSQVGRLATERISESLLIIMDAVNAPAVTAMIKSIAIAPSIIIFPDVPSSRRCASPRAPSWIALRLAKEARTDFPAQLSWRRSTNSENGIAGFVVDTVLVMAQV